MAEIAAYPSVGPRLPGRRFSGLPAQGAMGHLTDDRQFFIPKIECSDLRVMLEVIAGCDAICPTLDELAAPLLLAGTHHKLPFAAPWLRTHYDIMHLSARPLTSSAVAFQQAVFKAERSYFEKDPKTARQAEHGG